MEQTIPLLGLSLWALAKAFVLFGLGIYAVFAFVVVRQVDLMTQTLEVGLETTLRLIAIAHFILALGVVAFAFIIL